MKLGMFFVIIEMLFYEMFDIKREKNALYIHAKM